MSLYENRAQIPCMCYDRDITRYINERHLWPWKYTKNTLNGTPWPSVAYLSRDTGSSSSSSSNWVTSSHKQPSVQAHQDLAIAPEKPSCHARGVLKKWQNENLTELDLTFLYWLLLYGHFLSLVADIKIAERKSPLPKRTRCRHVACLLSPENRRWYPPQ